MHNAIRTTPPAFHLHVNSYSHTMAISILKFHDFASRAWTVGALHRPQMLGRQSSEASNAMRGHNADIVGAGNQGSHTSGKCLGQHPVVSTRVF